ncbi:MAG: hypothetical protein C4308_02525 [Chitinophagaceae bacterium]
MWKNGYGTSIDLLTVFRSSFIWVGIYCTVDIHQRKFKYASAKTGWLTLIFFAPLIGGLLYLASRKKIVDKPF